MSDPHQTFSRPNNDGSTRKLAYRQKQGRQPGVIFCGGFRSDMTGNKASALADWTKARDRAFLRFDYFGHGVSDGAFTDGTMSLWRADLAAMLDALVDGPQVLVGSSFGGWLSLMAALDRPEKVAALVLIAPAVDMTERLMWNRFSDEARTVLMEKGLVYDPSKYDPDGYPITRALIEDGRQHLMLGQPIELDIPVRIMHGQRDDAVPWQLTMELAEALTGDNVELHLLKNGDHRLSEPAQIDTLFALVDAVLN